MDVKLVYELRERLRAAAIAGTNLLAEDFRLRRALDAFRPLEAASPVFAKAGQMAGQLLSPDCQDLQGTLIETLTLVDAVVCTMAAVDAGDGRAGTGNTVHAIDAAENTASVIRNTPYSQLKGLIDALTTSGSGNYMLVYDMHRTSPEIFRDYRVRYAMVQALGASYSYLADMVKGWLMEEDASIIPLLKKNFDPKGKKEMQRRLEVITAIAGEKEKDFYLRILPDAEKEIRTDLIRILGAEPSNKELLLDMVSTEKGRNKQLVLDALAVMQDDRIDAMFEKMAKKKPEDVCEHLILSTTEGASRMISRMCLALLPEILEMQEGEKRTDDEKSKIRSFCMCVEALIGKSGEDVVRCYRMLLENQEKLDSLAGDEIEYCVLQSLFMGDKERSRRFTWEQTIGMHLANSLVLGENPQIAALAMEQYENQGGEEKNINFLTAATLVKLYEGEGCTEWYEEQSRTRSGQTDEDRLNAVRTALAFVKWDGVRHAHLMFAYVHGCQTILHENDDNKCLRRALEIPARRDVMDWMMKYKWDDLLYYWTDRDDGDECARMGEWFYNRCFDLDGQASPNVRHTMLRNLDYMNKCKWTKCKGLGEVFAMRGQPFVDSYQIQRFFEELPGTREEARAEMDVFIKLAEENKIKGISETGVAYYRNLRDKIF